MNFVMLLVAAFAFISVMSYVAYDAGRLGHDS
jgi:hypothetical protein